MGDLSSRERAILEILVGAYVATGEPIGSRTVSKSRLGLSAATIRNSMSDLEDKGYLCQPHTSAGRVPSDKGYRYYVDMLMAQEEVVKEVRQNIRARIGARFQEVDLETLLGEVCKVIAEVSHNLGVVLSPRFEQGIFQRFEMVQLSDSKLLIVLTIRSGLVKTMVMEIDSDIKSSDLGETGRVVNERFFGLTIGEILHSVKERLQLASKGSPKLLRLITDHAETIFKVSSGDDLHLGGTGNFLLQPEFSGDQEQMAGLMDLLEERDSIATALGTRMATDGIHITIGNENSFPELYNCSLLTSRYQVGNLWGIIGVIGPTRIPYAQLVPVVKFVADLTGEILDQH